jgi:hypothetical protein
MRPFSIEKIKEKISGQSAAVSRRNLGRSTFSLRRSDSTGDTSLREGKSKPSTSSTILSSWEDQSSSTSSPAPSHLKP